MSSDLYREILDDAAALARQAAHPKKGTLKLSEETAALLESIDAPQPSGDLRETGMADEALFQSASPAASAATLEELAGQVAACTACGLCETRTQTVFSDGNPNADVVFVGEAPGFNEDKQGVPFVGKAGQLLTDIIEKGMKLSRKDDTYICNVIKCRPPDNRDPSPDEKAACEGYLVRQLELVQPKVIVALGRHAAQSLLKTTDSTGRLRERWHRYHGIPLRVTYHPAYLLRNEADKGKTWADIQEVMSLLAGEVTLED